MSTFLALSAALLMLVPVIDAVPLTDSTTLDLASLNRSCNGNVHSAVPFARPCFSQLNGKNVGTEEAQCAQIQEQYTTAAFRADRYNGFMHTYDDSCASTEADSPDAQCLLDPSNPGSTPDLADRNCGQGSLSSHYIEVVSAKDAIRAFEYAARSGQSVSIKNSGHDYLARSSLKGSLALWTRSLQHMQYDPHFVPEGCTGDDSIAAVTIGGGVSFDQAYKFAEQNNITFVGGSSPTVGASGGFAMTGGHGLLTSQFGLGIDRALEYKIVTPDGVFRTANKYQNQDLFWALRGGGGGTFGVVLEMTAKVEPRMDLVIALILLPVNATNDMQDKFTAILAENAVRWSEEGWGGPHSPSSTAMVNPFLSEAEAEKSMASIASYVRSVGGSVTVESHSSFYSIYQQYVKPAGDPSTAEATLVTNRMLPTALLESETGRSKIQAELSKIRAAGLVPTIFQTLPAYYQRQGWYTEGSTSTTPAWRNGVWMITTSTQWAWNATVAEKRETVRRLRGITQDLYDLAPDGGSYTSEADPWTDGWQESWWGAANYARLRAVKAKYDPAGLLRCWRCVGSDPASAQFGCMGGLG